MKHQNCILIIDDDFINREVIKNVFDERYTFIEAYDGEQGLQIIEQMGDSLSAILLDVNMPKMTGLQMLQRIYPSGIAKHVPIFLVTAQDDFDTAREAYELGVMDVINKPIIPFIILRRVQSVIELFQARKTLSDTVTIQENQLEENINTIETLHRNTIEALASAIEFRDVETGEHTNRIYGITKILLADTDMGKGFSPEEIESMAIGSIMHDIGKIAISDIILNKPGKLTAEEYDIMKQHTVKGGALMQQIAKKQTHPSYFYACDIARHHHERWDGRGYPDGLKGEEITVWSQVASIADVYDALVSPRVYKRAFTFNEATKMIISGECGVFNPKLIKAFEKVEPKIRKLYEDRTDTSAPIGPGMSIEAQNYMIQVGREASDVLLLMAAAQATYDMIISVNLTQNRCHMIGHERFKSHRDYSEGIFDDLIERASQSVPESHRQVFIDHFGRKQLLDAFSSGQTTVTLDCYPQFGDDGKMHVVSTIVLLMRDTRNDDVLEITLTRYMDK